jgi:hypothetical protein
MARSTSVTRSFGYHDDMYFVEGALGLSRLAQTFYLKDTLHFGPAEMAAITGIFTIPWAIKPLYGFISDGFPFWGYRCRSYLVLSGIIGFLSYLCRGTDQDGFSAAIPLDPYKSAVVAPLSSAASLMVDVKSKIFPLRNNSHSSQRRGNSSSIRRYANRYPLIAADNLILRIELYI